MAPVPTSAEKLIAELRISGPIGGSALAAKLGISRATLSRLVASAGDAVLRYGAARATGYVATGDIRGETQWPLYRINADARLVELGQIRALHNEAFFVTLQEGAPALLRPPLDSGVFEALPWFIDDQRPQGFLGRHLAKRVSGTLRLPENLMFWSPRDNMVALLSDGHDQLGDLLVGERAKDMALQAIASPDAVLPGERHEVYATRADAALRGDSVGSSAAGEQPKFTAIVSEQDGYRPVIVKFTDALWTQAGGRWGELLRMEHRAGQVLAQAGLPAAQTQLVKAGNRLFLESTRFDRTAALGRCGFVSLLPIFSAFYGDTTINTWRALAAVLKRDGWISSEDADRLEVAYWFGLLIGNTDMHFGNAALILADDLPLALAPIYDMLPMVLKPASNGAVIDREIDIPAPTAGQFGQWRKAAVMAQQFWQGVVDDQELSESVRQIGARALENLRQTEARIG